MSDAKKASDHYGQGSLLSSIQAGLDKLGKSMADVTIDDFAPVDELHVGGGQATEHLIAQLDLAADDHVLDIGCGLGGAARFVADRFGCRVTGIDLTEEYVQTGTAINSKTTCIPPTCPNWVRERDCPAPTELPTIFSFSTMLRHISCIPYI